MKARDLRDMTRDELVQRHRDLDEELFNLRMRRSIKPLDNPLRLRQIGRDIARIMTVLTEDNRGIRKLAEAKTAAPSGKAKK